MGPTSKGVAVWAPETKTVDGSEEEVEEDTTIRLRVDGGTADSVRGPEAEIRDQMESHQCSVLLSDMDIFE